MAQTSFVIAGIGDGPGVIWLNLTVKLIFIVQRLYMMLFQSMTERLLTIATNTEQGHSCFAGAFWRH